MLNTNTIRGESVVTLSYLCESFKYVFLKALYMNQCENILHCNNGVKSLYSLRRATVII